MIVALASHERACRQRASLQKKDQVMTEIIQTANVKLVSIIGSSHCGDRIASDLRALGVSGYTKTKAEGMGVHGSRAFGIVDGANVRIDTLVGTELATAILQTIARNFAGQAVVAFAVDAEAVPASHFARQA
jgi:hypothetical protein